MSATNANYFLLMDLRIRKAYDIIKRRYREKLLLEQLAKEVDLSAFYFQRLFKKEMKETPAECVNRIRLERAAHLMVIDSTLSMTDIAYDCGFSSLSAFSRTFYKRFGETPIAMSKSMRQVNFDAKADSASSDLIIQNPALVYFPGCWIVYAHTSVFWDNLLNTFDSLKAFCEMEEIKGQTGRMFGVFTHIHLAFHGPKDQLNYYAGVEVAQKPDIKHHHRCFWIPEGKYGRFSTNTSYYDLFPLMVKFKADWMDKKALHIRDTFAVEQIAESNKRKDHPCLQRMVYTAVK